MYYNSTSAAAREKIAAHKKSRAAQATPGVFCMETIAFFDTKPYDRVWFEKLNPGYEIRWFDSRLNRETAVLAQGCAAVCAFVHDELDADTISALCAEAALTAGDTPDKPLPILKKRTKKRRGFGQRS